MTSVKRSQFRLRGPQQVSDSRITPLRGDLADIVLAGKYFAPHYAKAKMATCKAPSSVMTNAAHDTAVSQLLYGEYFAVLDVAGGYAWGYSAHDAYVGYVAFDDLAMGNARADHQISSRSALIFAQASIKSMVVKQLPMGARLSAEEYDDNFIQCADGFIHKRHVTPTGKAIGDSVDLARELIGAPYLWGGRSGDALDCSGLVQMILGLQGIKAPRDSDMQQAIGQEINADDELQRGDIIFFPGHVGIMSDSETIIHANAHWMQVKEEPLADVVSRLIKGGADVAITTRRRL